MPTILVWLVTRFECTKLVYDFRLWNLALRRGRRCEKVINIIIYIKIYFAPLANEADFQSCDRWCLRLRSFAQIPPRIRISSNSAVGSWRKQIQFELFKARSLSKHPEALSTCSAQQRKSLWNGKGMTLVRDEIPSSRASIPNLIWLNQERVEANYPKNFSIISAPSATRSHHQGSKFSSYTNAVAIFHRVPKPFG